VGIHHPVSDLWILAQMNAACAGLRSATEATDTKTSAGGMFTTKSLEKINASLLFFFL
jgi:hypothetical protein